MLLRMLPAAVLALAAAVQAPAQTTGPTTTPSPAASPAPAARARRAATTQRGSADLAAVRDAFDTLIDGIRKADAAAVMGVYWNSPRLMLFNNNGTVTRGWEQVRSNRESLYARVKDVKLDVRDVDVKLLGPSAALVTCLWEQSQTADGQPERATGRLTLVFQKTGAKWAAVHAHTSPDRPDPSRILPSERTGDGDAGTTRPPARP
ncbi:MAG TPA: nuclear transport factor 2 family protein [Pyrinomonadaceae bacterium]|nr:nuclear transport factor 2 family protein [Pyrinomonadaceae bacterium]